MGRLAKHVEEDLQKLYSMTKKQAVLAVDDEEYNLDILRNLLKGANYEPFLATGGDEALKILEKNPDKIDVILLDKTMPGMNGIELIKRVRENSKIAHIPIIMQTASADKESIMEGIKAGVFYYLTKPFDEEMLMSLVNSAGASSRSYKDLRERINNSRKMMGLVSESKFTFKTMEETKDLSAFIANFFPDPEKVVLGLSEIMINAVEHGNLQIGYNRKTELLNGGVWMEEVNKRQQDPKNAHKKVEVFFNKNSNEISVTIRDEGDGFDWRQYMDISSARAYDNHGRGIALANHISFDKVEYFGCGNTVKCSVKV